MTNRRTDYRVGRLSAERIALFENEFPDWQWRKQDAAFAVAFETGLAHLHRYVAAHGTSNARRRDVIDGFPIGTWVASRRADYYKGRLTAERMIRRLETEFPDWQWTVRGRS
ncbi:helicase associated domain-containing protein [Gordonia liuliyuniae]|uniref:helicase associated domain-containing protein n=1 Tax=Gordonia liuliyuniae TaxID=2911517 RepID=UPI0027E20205|nr:helicase associated domain-containing protein [Gordonia liuliyuniae]